MASSRVDVAVPLLTQAPPGQVTNVYDDLLGLIASEGDAPEQDEEDFKRKASVAREQHNVEQSIVVELPEQESSKQVAQSILCQSGVHAGERDRFLSPRHRISYKVDHTTLKTSDARPYKVNQHVEPLREELEKQLNEYIKDRYATGVVEVFAVPLPRQIVEVPDHVMEEAKAGDVDTLKPSQEITSDVSQAEEDKIEVEEKQTEEEKQGLMEEERGETEPVKDDPVEAAEAAAAVEANMNEDQGEKGLGNGDSKDEALAERGSITHSNDDEETQGETKLVIQLVANKYKLSNFWSGRWQSTYTLESSQASEVEASCSVQIHYFEEGNVQLHTRKTDKLAVEQGASTEATAKSIAKAIEVFEEAFQQELFKHSTDLSEGAFRALRRQLPMTRQKIDWDKVLNYKLGNELSKQ